MRRSPAQLAHPIRPASRRLSSTLGGRVMGRLLDVPNHCITPGVRRTGSKLNAELSGGYWGPRRSISMPNSDIKSSSISWPTTTTA